MIKARQILENHSINAVTRLIRVSAFPKVLIKCEHENPTGSHKDRAYREMIRSIDQSLDESILVDYTTGNGGISLAYWGRLIGVKVHVFMPEHMTAERCYKIRSLGAALTLTPASQFVKGAQAAAHAFLRENPKAILLDQSSNPANIRAFEHVGKEIVAQVSKKSIMPAAWVCVIGTGGTFSGIAKVLKDAYPGLHIVGIEDRATAAVYAKRTNNINFLPSSPSIIGAGAGFISKNTLDEMVDEIIPTSLSEIEKTIGILREEGLALGPSSAANIQIAHEVSKRINGDVLTTTFDRADRYTY